jgi:hypothetical protein
MEFVERRSGIDRRARTLGAFLYGGVKPRRVGGRREEDKLYPIVDWHSPRVLALAVAILALCVTDGVLTLVLMHHGATEANPFMALFVPHRLGLFAAVKLGLTSIGLLVLVACSRMKIMRMFPGELILYPILLGYVALIAYELRLLQIVQTID